MAQSFVFFIVITVFGIFLHHFFQPQHRKAVDIAKYEEKAVPCPKKGSQKGCKIDISKQPEVVRYGRINRGSFSVKLK